VPQSHTQGDKTKRSFRLSNLALLGVIGLLGAGVLMDGTLYNKPRPQNAIHEIDNAQSIELHFAGQKLLSFTKINDSWQQSQPVSAPVQAQRVQVLLDTNKYNQRKYAISDLPQKDIFTDPIKLKIDQAEYEFGTVEPVSQLRYVRTGNAVYLQPDTVVPLLGSANNAFIDLKITDEVQNITIGDTTLESPVSWSNLKAIDVTDVAPSGPGLDIELSNNNEPLHLKASYTDTGYMISKDDGFTYLLDTLTAESLGLTDFLPKE